MATLKERVLDSLKAIGTWSKARDVYNYMVKNGIDVGVSKTPDATVSAMLVTYSKNGVIEYRKTGKGAGLYGLSEWDNQSNSLNFEGPGTEQHEQGSTEDSTSKKEPMKERALHQLLCNYLWDNDKHEYSKTIYQERSNRNDSSQKWVHPDIIGVTFVDTKQAAAEELLKATKTNEAMKLCSYELKIRLMNDYELKQAYFQALSNSNWANFGYLVAFEISDDSDMLDEMERLNQSFGIGIIKLGALPSQTRILFPAKKKELDFRTIDKLCSINSEFNEFIDKVTNVITAEKKYINDVKNGLNEICDKILLDEDEIKEYCHKNNIPIK